MLEIRLDPQGAPHWLANCPDCGGKSYGDEDPCVCDPVGAYPSPGDDRRAHLREQARDGC